MNKRVVLDDSSLLALLRLGYREGTVCLKAGVHLDQLTEHSDPLLEAQVLEQIVLTPQVLAFFDRGSLCEDLLEGELLESDSIVRTPTPSTLDNVEALPMELVTGILRARGFKVPEEEFLPRLGSAIVMHNERERRSKEGRRFPELGDHIRRAMKIDELSTEEWAFHRDYQEITSRAQPILDAFAHAQTVMTAAAQNSAYGMLPYSQGSTEVPLRNPSFAREESEESKRLTLFRVVSEDIGTLLPPKSLSSALRLGKSSEAEALREKSSEWIEKIEAGELGGIEPIRKEIKLAIRSLEKVGLAKSIGSMLTLTAVPIGVAEMMLGSPGVVGLGLGAVGTIAEVNVRSTEKRYRWALFGKR
jgi:hypothetical protein